MTKYANLLFHHVLRMKQMDSAFDRISPFLQSLGFEGLPFVIGLTISRGGPATKARCVILSLNYMKNCIDKDYVEATLLVRIIRIHKYMIYVESIIAVPLYIYERLSNPG